MTEAEQKAASEAAAKAAAEKTAAEKGGKEDVAGKEDEAADDDDGGEDPKAHIAKLNAENKKHRLAAKATKAQNAELLAAQERTNKALALLQGKEVGSIDPLLAVQKASDAKMRNAFLKAAVAAEAGKDAHDVGAVFELAKSKLSGVTVDLDTEEVDADELKEVLDEMRESKPFLFKKADENVLDLKNAPPKKGVKNPPDSGKAVGGANFYQTYQQLLSQNRLGEAQEFYNKNRASIMVQMKSNPNLG